MESGVDAGTVAEAAGVCPGTVRKWVESAGRCGIAGSVIPAAQLRQPTPHVVVEEIELRPAALDGQADRRDRGLASHCLFVITKGDRRTARRPPA